MIIVGLPKGQPHFFVSDRNVASPLAEADGEAAAGSHA